MAQVPDILNGPSAPLPGHENLSLVQNTAESQPGINLASLINGPVPLCWVLSSQPPLQLWVAPDPVPSNEMEGKVCERRERKDIWESFCFFIKGTGVEGKLS